LVFAVVHAVISMVGVVAVGIVGFGYDNYGFVADYTVDLGLADFAWKYFETIETEMADGAAGFEEVVVVVVVGKMIVVVVVVVGKMIVVVVVVVGKVIVVVVVGKMIVVVVAVVVGKVIVVVVGNVIVVDIVHMTAVVLAGQQQNFPLDDVAVVV